MSPSRRTTHAPVALFCYKRLTHLAAVIDALERCAGFESSPLYVFCDGPRTRDDAPKVEAVRRYVRARLGERAEIVAEEKNRGLASSIISGVGALCGRHGAAIVLEDDLVLQPAALSWMNGCLQAYRDRDDVAHVSAYQYRVPELAHSPRGTFQRFTSSWGWATWERAWSQFDFKATGWEAVLQDRNVRRAFDHDANFPSSDMLVEQMQGAIDSWVIRWGWTCFNKGYVSVMPPRSLVRNIGFDATATHNSLGWLKRYVAAERPLLWSEPEPPGLPLRPGVDPSEERAFRRALRQTHALRNHRIKQVAATLTGGALSLRARAAPASPARPRTPSTS